jgi:hypothetical protein
MKNVLLALCLSLAATQAHADQRYMSTGMSCDKVQSTIRRDGAAVMRWSSTRVSGLPLYGRYVRSLQFCVGGQVLESAYIPAADTYSCQVQECVEYERLFYHHRSHRH